MKTVNGFTVDQLLNALDLCAKNGAKFCQQCPYQAPCHFDGGAMLMTDAAELIKTLIRERKEPHDLP